MWGRKKISKTKDSIGLRSETEARFIFPVAMHLLSIQQAMKKERGKESHAPLQNFS
jgi:hypothetical protein